MARSRSLRPVDWPDVELLGPAPADTARVRRMSVRQRAGGAPGDAAGDLQIEVVSCGPWGSLCQEIALPLTAELARDLVLELLPLLSGLSGEDRRRVANAVWGAVHGL